MSDDIEHTVKTNVGDHARAVSRIADIIPGQVNASLHKLANIVIARAQDYLMENDSVVTKVLYYSLQVLEETEFSITVGTALSYAYWVETGRGFVFPKREGGMLRWLDPETGEYIYAKFARPADPRPFMEPAVLDEMGEFVDITLKNLTSSAYAVMQQEVQPPK